MTATVRRVPQVGMARMHRGQATWEEPQFWAVVEVDGKEIAHVSNGSLLCLLEGAIRAPEATDAQILAAVLGDEHVYGKEQR